MRLFSSFLLLLAVLLLNGCGGEAMTRTRYELPPTPGGRLCVNQCEQSQHFCQEACDIERRDCIMHMQKQAIEDYEKYAREQFEARQPQELLPRDFERPELCKQTKCVKKCTRAYQGCFQECGGRVTVNTSCQFLCF